jgi:glycosidase
LALNPNFDPINAERARADADSVFHHCRQWIQLRRQPPAWVHGRTLPLLAEHPQIAAYLRVWQGAQLLLVCNFSADAPQCGGCCAAALAGQVGHVDVGGVLEVAGS